MRFRSGGNHQGKKALWQWASKHEIHFFSTFFFFFLHVLRLYTTLWVMTDNLVSLRLFPSLAKNALIYSLLRCLAALAPATFGIFPPESCLL